MLINAVYDLEQYTWALKPVVDVLTKRGHSVITSRVCPSKDPNIQATIAIQSPSGFRGAVGKKVWISHGISCTKGWGPPKDIDIYIAPAKYWVDALNQHLQLHQDEKPFQIWETGWPKSDVLKYLNDHYTNIRQEVYTKRHYDRDRPIIGYFPTYAGGPHTKRTNSIENVFSKLRNTYNIAAVWHQMEPALNKQQFDRAGCYRKMDFFKLKMFSACDVLISDTSSMVYEFLIFNRPIVLLKTSEDPGYLHIRNKASEPLLDMGHITDVDHLFETVQHALQNPMELEAKRTFWRDWVFGPMDGNCSLRVVKALEKEFSDGKG